MRNEGRDRYIACLVYFLEYFDGVTSFLEKINVLDEKVLFPFFVLFWLYFFQRLNYLLMRFRIVTIFVKSPIMILNFMTLNISPKSILEHQIIPLLKFPNNSLWIHFNQFVKLVPILVDKCLYIQHIFQDSLGYFLFLGWCQVRIRRLKRLDKSDQFSILW